jgi:hypothetical protein
LLDISVQKMSMRVDLDQQNLPVFAGRRHLIQVNAARRRAVLSGSLVANRMTSVLFLGVSVGCARLKTCKAHKAILVALDPDDETSWREPLVSAGPGRI